MYVPFLHGTLRQIILLRCAHPQFINLQAKASSGSATLSAVNKTTGTPKIGTADTQNSQASNTTKPSQKKVRDIFSVDRIEAMCI